MTTRNTKLAISNTAYSIALIGCGAGLTMILTGHPRTAVTVFLISVLLMLVGTAVTKEPSE